MRDACCVIHLCDFGLPTSNFGLWTQKKAMHRQALDLKLSKFLLLILRHQPERFGLALDEEGWASLAEVLQILHGLPNFRWASRADVRRIVAEGSGDEKRRFKVADERIRACRRSSAE